MFSLIIPCYNEEKNIPLLIEKCSKIMMGPDDEIIFVDNGSTDKTAQIFHELIPHFPQIRSIRVDTNQGYGFGILSGLNAAKGDILGWTHADLQTNPEDAWKGLNFFKGNKKNIFVKGQRTGRSIFDLFFTWGMSFFETLLLKKWFWDINSQPTLFSRSFFETWKNPPLDFSLDLFVYYEAQKSALKIVRFPVHFGKRQHGVSSWNTSWKEKIKFIKKTIDFSFELKRRLKNASDCS